MTTLNSSFFQTIEQHISLGVSRAAIMLLVKDQLAEIDKGRKGLVDSMAKEIRVLSATDAAKVANGLIMAVPSAKGDANARSRRRNLKKTFTSVLESAFPEYDFPSKDGCFELPKWEGNADRREAKKLISAWHKLSSMGFLVGEEPTIEDVVEGITASKATTNETAVDDKSSLYLAPLAPEHDKWMLQIAANISGIKAEEVKAKKVKQA